LIVNMEDRGARHLALDGYEEDAIRDAGGGVEDGVVDELASGRACIFDGAGGKRIGSLE
jgi:hypothetical protein